MKRKIIFRHIAIALLALFASIEAKADVNPDFYIYLCIGQSNMEGQGNIETQDKTGIDPRFMMMSPINCGSRKVGEWITAVPPLCRCNTKLCPADYFGRAMVENLPENVSVGVINVAVAGCKIDLFDKDGYQTYINNEVTQAWQQQMVNAYDGNPYGKLIAAAKLAQQSGVIKGILLHQGESDAYNTTWINKVQKVYGDILNDLGLEAADVPLIAGEVVRSDMGGQCGSANNTINKLPNYISTSYVVSSEGLGHQGDNLHFSSESYRKLGKRYAAKALSLMGIAYDPDQTGPQPEVKGYYLEAENMIGDENGQNFSVVSDASCSSGKYVTTVKNATTLSNDKANWLIGTVNIEEEGDYNIFARVMCPSYDDDSYYISFDDNDPAGTNGLYSPSWSWLEISSSSYVFTGTFTSHLTAGTHRVNIIGREDGACIDRIFITNGHTAPTGLGETTSISGVTADPTTTAIYSIDGRRFDSPQRGINIIRTADGATRKVLLK